MRVALAVVASLLGGCQLYFGGDDAPEPPCEGWGGIGMDDSYNQLRNPQTGECQDVGGRGGGCDSCGNCDDYAEPGIAYPNWPQCHSQCEALDEESCLGASGCQAAYWEQADYQDAPSVTTFRGCYATVGGPELYSSCWNLDSNGCAQHDNCALIYVDHSRPNYLSPLPYEFVRCEPEPSYAGCAAVTCGPGYHCEESCYPTPGDPNEPDCAKTGGCGGTQCTPMCVPDQGYGCEAIDCGPGFECVETCSTTDPTTMGGCFPGECWATCVPTTACETLATQQACDARNDCTSVFDGQNCTCYPGGYCECEILTWDRCESLGVVPMPL